MPPASGLIPIVGQVHEVRVRRTTFYPGLPTQRRQIDKSRYPLNDDPALPGLMGRSASRTRR
jgi:hypothetical protein